MKNNILAMVFGATALVSTTAALAADGTINFTGDIKDSACVVDNSGAAMSVPLGTISKSVFNGSGSTAAATKFTIALKTCPAGMTKATVKFDGMPAGGDLNVLALTSGTGIATGVGLQLQDKTGAVLALGSNSAEYTLKSGTVGADNINNLDFTARYIATASTVSAGSANATASFTINYN